MRLQPAHVEDTVAFVQQQCPAGHLLNRTVDRLSFSIPQEVNQHRRCLNLLHLFKHQVSKPATCTCLPTPLCIHIA